MKRTACYIYQNMFTETMALTPIPTGRDLGISSLENGPGLSSDKNVYVCAYAIIINCYNIHLVYTKEITWWN